MVCEAAERAMVHAEDAPTRAPSSVWPRWGRGFGAWKSPQGSLGGRRAASNLPTIIPEGTFSSSLPPQSATRSMSRRFSNKSAPGKRGIPTPFHTVRAWAALPEQHLHLFPGP
jgi:hypothetical protein